MNKNFSLNQYRNKPFVTYGIIAVSILLFVMMTISGGSQNINVLFNYGAKVNFAIILFNQWWRLITPIFLHIGFAHLAFNLIIVYYLGSQLEMLFGHGKYAILYLLSGIMGNIFSFAFNASVSAGASTAIFGLFVSTIVLSKLYPHQIQFQAIARQYGLLIGMNIIFGLLSSGVDNMGHIGGLIGGYFVTYMISKPNYHHSSKDRLKYGLFYVGIALIFIAWGYNGLFYIGF